MTDLNSPSPWPDDAITLTYGEIRQLIALHLDRLGDSLGRVAPWEDAHRTARAMRDGETPLLIRDVLSPPEPGDHSAADEDPRGPLVMHDPGGWQRWRERAASLIAKADRAGIKPTVRAIAELCGYAYQVGRADQRHEAEPERPLPGLADGPFDGPEQARASAATDELVRLGGRRPRTALAGEDGPEAHRRALATPDHDHTLELVVPAAGIVRCTGDHIDWEGAGD